ADTEDETAGDEADGSGAVVGMFRPPPQPAAPPMPAAAAVTTAGQLAQNLAAVAGQANALFAGVLVNPPPGVNTAAHAGLVQPLAAALWTFNVTQQLVTGFGARLQWLQQWAAGLPAAVQPVWLEELASVNAAGVPVITAGLSPVVQPLATAYQQYL